MIILINSINPALPAVAVYSGREVTFGTELGAAKSGGFILKELKSLEAKKILSLKKIKRLAVLSGPGSFSGVRSGMAVANALGASLGVPVVLLDTKEFDNLESAEKIIMKKKARAVARPVYDREPNITISKHKLCPVEQP